LSIAQIRPIHSSQGTSEKISFDHELQERFKSEQYQIDQPYFQLTAEGYTISSVNGSEKFTALRPRHIFRSLFARMLGFFGFVCVLIGAFVIVGSQMDGIDKESARASILGLAAILGGFGGGFFAYHIISVFCAPIRRATVKDSTGAKIMTIEPVSRFHIFNSEFSIRDGQGKLLATFKKNFWASIFQKRWHAHDFRGKYMFTAIEDDLFLSLLRRYLNLARFIPMHFMFTKNGGKPFGEFRRGYSLRDKYKLRYNPAAADGWLMVASSILLDTGEKR
jgi:uncharacterized protein YxjI